MNLGETLKKARTTAGLTQQKLADKIGVYAKDISRWEHEQRTPSSLALARICTALGASADEILELNK